MLFGYVVGAAILIYLVASIIYRKRWALRALAVASIALAVCVPYLYRNYSLTGRVFYWAQSGGLSLYWMSSPMGEEYGDWLTGTKPWLGGYWRAEKHHEFLEGLQDPQKGYKALAAAFDDPLVTDLNVYNIGDGGAISGLMIAAWRKKTGEVTFLVFLMD